MAKQKIFFDIKKSYIITGGLGGIGLELADWMIKKGATKLVLNCRRGVMNSYQTFCLTKWKQFKRSQVVIRTEDTSDIHEAKRLIIEAEKLGSLGGIYSNFK